jgi:RNA polymerase sigma-70 factor (ECF subfamily)
VTKRIFAHRTLTDRRDCVSAPLPTMPEDIPGAPLAPDFAEVYAQQFGFVWRCLRALGVPEGTLDDAAQDVFLVVHRRLAEFRGDSALRTWLYGVIRNVASNQRRSARRRPAPVRLAIDLASPGPGPHERIEERQAAEFVQRFVAGLSDEKRDVFVLAVIEQMSIPAVAEMLGIPLNTAYTRLRSVRLEFKRAFESEQ